MTTSRSLLALIAGLTLTAPGVASAASPAGMWQTPEDHGLVEVYDCGGKLCGRIVTSDKLKAQPDLKDAANKDPALRDRPLKSLVLMRNFDGGPVRWRDGAIYRPQDGGTYKGSMELVDPNTLKLTGCVVAPLCKTQVWKRVK
ncbi:MAG: DUF2147 domain-containing protein [Caulobacter sp.]|nr:DUF2147 domain-containing protein [Caulobacter sp.]